MEDASTNPYPVLIKANRLDGYMKHAFLLNREHNTNLAFLANGSLYNLDGTFGLKEYGDRQSSLNSQLVLEHDFNDEHNLSTGFSFNADQLDETLTSVAPKLTTEYTPGVFAQYTYKPSYKFTAMAGLRADRSTLYNRTYLTPRLHVKWVAADWVTLRASTGKGYRTPHALAENHYLLTSGRTLAIADLKQEEAWNGGLSMVFYIPLMERTLTVNAEYYYTDFINQIVLDRDADAHQVRIYNLDGKSYSNSIMSC